MYLPNIEFIQQKPEIVAAFEEKKKANPLPKGFKMPAKKEEKKVDPSIPFKQQNIREVFQVSLIKNSSKLG